MVRTALLVAKGATPPLSAASTRAPTRPGSARRRGGEAGLAARAPVQRPPVAPLADDGRGAALARLAGTAVHGQPAVDAGERDPLGVAQVGPYEPGRHLDHARRLALGEITDGSSRVELPRPQELAAVHVAESAQHPLVEQHVGEGGGRVVVGDQRPHAAGEVGVDPRDVRPEPAQPGWRSGSGRRYVSTIGALKHTATQPSTSIRTRSSWCGRCQASPRRWTYHDPRRRRLVCRIVSSSHSISTCRPWHSTRSIVRPARGVMPMSRGASKRIIFSSTSAVRSAAAARWIESPSGIRPQPYAGDRRQTGTLAVSLVTVSTIGAQVANATRRPSRMAAAAVRGARQSPIDVVTMPSPSSSAESSARATGVPATTSQSKPAASRDP